MSEECYYLHFTPGKRGAGRLNALLKVMQDRFEFQIANTSLANPSFTLAGLYIAPCSHSQLNESDKDTEPGMHDKEMTVQ